MTNETEVALAAISALCGKRKAKALRKLVLAAIEAERALASLVNMGGGIGHITLDYEGVSSTYIGGAHGADGTATHIYTAQGTGVQAIDPHYTQGSTA